MEEKMKSIFETTKVSYPVRVVAVAAQTMEKENG
jgi:hypothetical protein